MQTFVILNPQAGGGRAGAIWPQIRTQLENSIGKFAFSQTGAPEDATHLARKAISDGAELIISVGGDGTSNEVANGFFTSDGRISRKCALALVPCGTGSDFCRTLGLASDPAAAISEISQHNERAIDVGVASFHSNEGKLASRLFLNIASFGLSGAISDKMSEGDQLRWLPVKLKYLIETFRGLRSYKPAKVRLTVDDITIDREVMFVAIANGRCFGGGMMVAPDADPQDGLLDVIVLNAITKARLARKIALVYRGAHIGLPEIEVFRGARIVAQSENGQTQQPIFLEVDGEAPGTLDCEFTIRPSALRLWQ